MHPNAVTTVSLNGKGTQPGIIYKTLAFLFLYIFIILIGGTIISLSGLPLGDSLFSALEAIPIPDSVQRRRALWAITPE